MLVATFRRLTWHRRVLGAVLLAMAIGALIYPPVAHVAVNRPDGLTAIAFDGKVELAWKSTGAGSYVVLRGASATSIGTVVASNVTGTAYNDTAVTNGTTYYYAVRESGSSTNPVSAPAGATPRAASCSTGNTIARENCFPGTTSWKAVNSGPAPAGIEGFATATSINAGGSLDFKVNAADGAPYHIDIYRTGYYGGSQGRLIGTLANLTGVAQPDCYTESTTTGIIDCGNWATSATVTTTADWPTGVYIARLVRDDNGSDNHIMFVVRKDGDHADIAYRVPDTSYEAYNNYGGKSLYTFNSFGNTTVAGTARAVKVSFNRPYIQSNTNNHDWYTSSDLATVSWMERQGFDIDYLSSVDLETGAGVLSDHRVAISANHDEYWSSAMRTATVSARNAGTSLVFLGGNALYWRIRFESSPTTGTANRTVVTYKTVESGVTDPQGPTSTWRDPNGPNQPENAVIGQMYTGDNDNVFFPLKVPAALGKNRFWRHTGEDTLAAGTTDSIGQNLVGWEWDQRYNNGLEPAGVTSLSSSPVTGSFLQDAGKTYASGSGNVTSTVYTAPSGALVWATGTNHWSRGLANNMSGVGEPNSIIQQATLNMLSDMGATATTPASGMVLDPSGPWSVTSQTPAAGATNVATTSTVKATFDRSIDPSTLTSSSFTVTNSGGSAIAGSLGYDDSTRTATFTPTSQLDGNASYTASVTPAVKAWMGGTPSQAVTWSFTTGAGQPPAISSRAPAAGATGVGIATTVKATFDRSLAPSSVTTQTFRLATSGGQAVSGSVVYDDSTRTVTLTPSQPLNGTTQYTVTATTGITATDGTPLASTQTWSFTTGTPLSVIGRTPQPFALGVSPASDVRATFSRALDPTTVTSQNISLTGPGGAVAATVTYDPNAPGFDLVPSQPLALSTTYTATVGTGVKAADGEALAAALSWTFTTADVAPAAPAPTTLYPASGAVKVPSSAPIQATFDRALDAGSVTTQSVLLRDPQNVVQAAAVAYDAASQTITLTPAAQMQPGATYTAQLTTAIRSATGAPMAANVSWSFTVADCPCNLMPNTMAPAQTGIDVRDGRPAPGPWSYELGTKIAVDSQMKLIAVRFWKDAGETGTHVGRIWSSTGTLLGSATFANETASGWQRQTLATPVTLNPGQNYVVSVNLNAKFVVTQFGLQSQLTSGPLRSVADGANGVFGNSAGTFPTGSYRSSNYFVDAVVRTPTSVAPAPGVTSQSPLSGATGVSATTNVHATFDIPLDPSTVTGSTFTLKDSGGNTVPATVAYNSTTQTATLDPASDLSPSTTYTAQLTTGVKSDEGVALASAVSWSFTIAAPPPPTVTSTSPTNGATNIGSAAPVQATFSTTMDASTLTASSFSLAANGSSVPATVAYDGPTRTATLTPSSRLTPGTTYTATLTTDVKSAAGLALPGQLSWSFTTAACPCALFGPGATPASVSNPTRDGRSGTGPWTYELGVKIKVSSASDLTAIKFYKGPSETGSHVGRIWSSTGALIASVPFTGETASGWQSQTLDTPVTLAPGATYTVSVGFNAYFVSTLDALATSVVNGPLSSVVGSNGVFANVAGVFPTGSYRNSNYFIDAVVR